MNFASGTRFYLGIHDGVLFIINSCMIALQSLFNILPAKNMREQLIFYFLIMQRYVLKCERTNQSVL